jgi:hypothetical protein
MGEYDWYARYGSFGISKIVGTRYSFATNKGRNEFICRTYRKSTLVVMLTNNKTVEMR